MKNIAVLLTFILLYASCKGNSKDVFIPISTLTDYYVTVKGNDNSGNDSEKKPFVSIEKALSVLPADKGIMLYTGGFALRLMSKIKNSKSIEGLQQQYQIIMFGNSLIENGGDWGKRLDRNDIKNSGRSGFTTSHFVWLLNDYVLKYKPKICFLEGGINDIGVGIPLERIKKNYQSMVDTLLAHHIQPVLNAVLYTNQHGKPEDRKRTADMIDGVNAYLRMLSKEKNISMINLNPQLSENRTLKAEYTTDGVHLRSEAYDIWIAAIQKTLSSLK